MAELRAQRPAICSHVEINGKQAAEYQVGKKDAHYIEATENGKITIINNIPRDFVWLENATCLEFNISVDGINISHTCHPRGLRAEGCLVWQVDRAHFRVPNNNGWQLVPASMGFSPISKHLSDGMDTYSYLRDSVGEIRVEIWQCIHRTTDKQSNVTQPTININKILVKPARVQDATHLVAFRECKLPARPSLDFNHCPRLENRPKRTRFLYRSKARIDGLKGVEVACACAQKAQSGGQSLPAAPQPAPDETLARLEKRRNELLAQFRERRTARVKSEIDELEKNLRALEEKVDMIEEESGARQHPGLFDD